MGKRHTLDFTKNKKAPQRRAHSVVAGIVVFVLAAGLISFVVLLGMNDFSVAKFLGTRTAETTAVPTSLPDTQSTERETEVKSKGRVNILFLCTGDGGVTFCEIISADVSAGSIHIKPVSPDIKLTQNGKTLTLSETYAQFALNGVKTGLQEKGIATDRYIEVTENNFRLLMKKLGQVDIEIKSDISFTVEAITYTMSAGIQTMSSDMLLKYMKYASSGDALLELQAKAVSTIVKTFYTGENIAKGEDYFSQLINFVKSDITAFDFSNNYDTLYYFAGSHPDIGVII